MATVVTNDPVWKVACPKCRATAGNRCKNYLGKGKPTCKERIELFVADPLTGAPLPPVTKPLGSLALADLDGFPDGVFAALSAAGLHTLFDLEKRVERQPKSMGSDTRVFAAFRTIPGIGADQARAAMNAVLAHLSLSKPKPAPSEPRVPEPETKASEPETLACPEPKPDVVPVGLAVVTVEKALHVCATCTRCGNRASVPLTRRKAESREDALDKLSETCPEEAHFHKYVDRVVPLGVSLWMPHLGKLYPLRVAPKTKLVYALCGAVLSDTPIYIVPETKEAIAAAREFTGFLAKRGYSKIEVKPVGFHLGDRS